MSIFKTRKTSNTITSATPEVKTSTDATANVAVENSSGVYAMGKDNKTVNELKSILKKRWKEQEKCEKIPYEEMFQEIVDEAVYKIIEKWKTRAELNDEYKEKAGEEIESSTSSIFFVSDETRGLSSNDCNLETFPKTGRACLFNTLILPTADEENRFIDSVMKKLLEGTVCEINKMKWDKFRSGNFYSFKIKIVPDKK